MNDRLRVPGGEGGARRDRHRARPDDDVNAYTSDQRLQDAPGKDPRRACAAVANLVTASTGAAKAIGVVIPELPEDAIVSSDIVKRLHSSIYDSQLTAVLEGSLVKAISWPDNEWAYSNRRVELARQVLVHAHA